MATGVGHIGRMDAQETRKGLKHFRGWFEPTATSSTAAPTATDLPTGWTIAHASAGKYVLTLDRSYKKIVSHAIELQSHAPQTAGGTGTSGFLVGLSDHDVKTAKTISILCTLQTVSGSAIVNTLTDIPNLAGVAGNRIFFEFTLSDTDVANQ